MKKTASFLACLILSAALTAGAAEPVRFEMHRIGSVRSEACGVGDFNNDGKPDIVAGPNLYLAPDFKPVKIREITGEVTDDGKGYADDFMNEPLDVDGDGNLDVVAVCWFAKGAWWYRNPGPGKEGLWEEHLITGGQKAPAVGAAKVGKAKKGKAADSIIGDNHETGELVDVDGDGKAREILPHIKGTKWYEFPKGADGKVKPVAHTISEKAMDFGVGVGDINGDGRPDVIRPECWYEGPADPRTGVWKEHAFAESLIVPQPDRKPPIAKHISMVLVHDVNGDGLADLVYTMAHAYGIFWMEQVKKDGAIAFTRHLIDKSWTQPHAIALADIDGCGVKELITGKRFMAHNGADPEETAPLGVYYYKQLGTGKDVKWEKHTISFDEKVGTSLNIPVVDLDGDGDLDIVATGKWGGPVWFENKLK